VKLRKHAGLYERQLKTDDGDIFNDASNNLDYKVECIVHNSEFGKKRS
jgi:hypothetical protein